MSNYINIKSFLKEPKFEKCKIIHLNLVCHTDSNNLYYEDKPLSERFLEIVPITKYGGKYLEIRSIVNSRISKGMFRHAYILIVILEVAMDMEIKVNILMTIFLLNQIILNIILIIIIVKLPKNLLIN